MAGRQLEATTKAIKWFLAQGKTNPLDRKFCMRAAAAKFGVHETTLWRALGKQKANGK